MAEFSFDKNEFENIIDWAIESWAQLLYTKVASLVPRDLQRLPNNINRKDWKKPQRNVWRWKGQKKWFHTSKWEVVENKHYYRPPKMINWNWYEWVSWALKRSLDIEKLWKWEYIVWVKRWPTEDYAGRQEFWWRDKLWRNVPERSYLRKWIKDNDKEIINQIQKTFNELSK